MKSNVLVMATLGLGSLYAQRTQPAAPSYKTEEYLLLGDATRGAGEPMIAVDPTNPKNMIATAMGSLQQLPGAAGRPAPGAAGSNAWPRVGRSTITWLAVTHDGGVTWKVGELPILYSASQRCPDAFADVTRDGVFIAGCEPRQTTPGGNESASLVVSHDKGETWSAPVEIIGYTKERFAPGLRPRIAGASPYDRPFTIIDDSTGVIYGVAQGGTMEDEAGKVRSQAYITASKDGGKSFGAIYAWDSKEYPQVSRGLGEAAGFAEVAVVYNASSVPAKEQAGACPCPVFGLSKDEGKTFSYHVIKGVPAASQAVSGSAANPPSNMVRLTADPTKAGRYAILIFFSTPNPHYEVIVSEDHGQTLSKPVTAATVPGSTYFSRAAFEYSRDGVLALMWRTYFPNGNYEIWSSISKDSGKTFSNSVRVSHAPSPAGDPIRTSGSFGDDIQDLSMDRDNVHMVWGDWRAGFLGTFYGRVPFSAYEFNR